MIRTAVILLAMWAVGLRTVSAQTGAIVDPYKFSVVTVNQPPMANLVLWARPESLATNANGSKIANSTTIGDGGGDTFASDGSASDVQAKINSAVDGDTVTIPASNFTWSSQVTINKGIHLQGAGSGRVVARSASSVAVGTGTKTFTVNASGLNITAGQTLRIERTGNPHVGGNPTGTRTYMIGTVTTYSGTTLTMNISSTGGSGTHPLWIVSSTAATTITHNAGSTLISLTEDTTHSVELSGIRLVDGTGSSDFVGIANTSGGKPVLIHDCYFESTDNYDCIQTGSNRGVLWNCSFPAFPISQAQLAIHQKDCPTTSWTTASTMGLAADPDGVSNFYIEDCDFHAWYNAMDIDDSARATVRHTVFNNAGFGTHGADTSNYGVRHYEVYESEFVFNGYGGGAGFDGNTMNLNWWFYLRGGTGVIASNVMPAITSADYGPKTEINYTIMNLHRNGGPNPCYTGGYPVPRQVGMGRVTGAAGNDSITYKGDSEPLYIWGNTGNYNASASDYGPGNPNYCVGAGEDESTSSYVVAGRDFYNNNTPKPSYSFFTYPHPLRSGAESGETRWDDSSGLGNHITNAVTADIPTLLTNQLNGFNAAFFDGTTNFMYVPTITLGTNWTVSMIYKEAVGDFSYHPLLWDSNTLSAAVSDSGNGALMTLDGAQVVSQNGHKATNYSAATWISSNGVVRMYFNGNEITGVGQPVLTVNQVIKLVGAKADGGDVNAASPQFVEILVYTNALTGVLRTNLDTYLFTRFDLDFYPATFDLTNGLVAYWKLDEASGTRNDSIGASHLTDNNTVASATGKISTGADFERDNTEWLNCVDNAALSTGTSVSFTWNLWVKLESKAAADGNVFLHKDDFNTAREYGLYYDGPTDRFVFYTGRSGTGTSDQVNADAFGSPSTGTWYMLTCVHDVNGGVNTICVNNGTVNSAAYTTGPADTAAGFGMGRFVTAIFYLDGVSDEISLHKRVLTAAESSWLWNDGNGRTLP